MIKLDRQTFQAKFNQLDNTHKLGVRRNVLIVTGMKCLSLFSLISAFYFFAQAMHEWVVNTQQASQYLDQLIKLAAKNVYQIIKITILVKATSIFKTCSLPFRLYAKSCSLFTQHHYARS